MYAIRSYYVPCVRRPLRQWVLRITAFADALLEGLDDLDWPDSTKEMQRNWIGRSEGCEVDFAVAESTEKIRIFTTRPDTLYGATFMSLAPEHPLALTLTVPEQQAEVEAFVRKLQNVDRVLRTSDDFRNNFV